MKTLSPTQNRTSSLGKGCYSIGEAAKLAGIPYGTARSWFTRWPDGRVRLLQSDHASASSDIAISFLDLIDARTVRYFRNAGLSLSIIRKSYETLSQRLNTDHPFAHADLYTDGKRILHEWSNEIGDRVLEDAIDRQGFFSAMKGGLHKVQYDEATGLAIRWPIYHDIMIDPEVSMGKPAVDGTATRTAVIANQFYANDENAGIIADLYGISEQQVLHAVEFEQSLRKPKAA